MNCNSMQTGLLRFFIILLWVVILALFLIFPSLFHFGKTDREITLLTWAATIDPQVLVDFENETGIKINIRYFESNEELFVKLVTTKGKGYDLVMPSDYAIPKLVEHNLLKPLDKSKIDFFDRLNPQLLDHYFDPNNTYSIPYYFGIYGLGINKKLFSDLSGLNSWGTFFKKEGLPGRVAMPGVAREAVLIAAQYLFDSVKNITPEKLTKIQKLLVDQKPNVETYIDTDIRTNYLLINETCPLVVAASPYIIKGIAADDALDFLIPQETFRLIDALVIPASSDKQDMVYELLNYLYRPDIVKYHFVHYPFLPATSNLEALMQEEGVPDHIISAHFDRQRTFNFFIDVLSEKEINQLWMSLKTA